MKASAVKSIYAKWPGKCHYCADSFEAGTLVKWDSGSKAVYHPSCYSELAADQQAAKEAQTFKAEAQALKAAKAAFAAQVLKAPPAPQPGPIPFENEPVTQKARGILALQRHGILAVSFARIARTLEEARQAFLALPGICKKFMRGCPEHARHGFVDSKVVDTLEDVDTLWAECKAADPKAEAILMPYVNADYNMLWRPGLLACGPGHAGATAGLDSISVLLQAQYSTGSQVWQTIARDAGVDLETKDPYIEAVSSPGYETVITQVRAGVKVVPTEENWNPEEGFEVAHVVTLTKADKEVPGKMEAWEKEAEQLPPGTVIYTPGDNLGSHWSVHAQLQLEHRGAVVPVLTSFCPAVGDRLKEMGVKPVPLDPQALMWGFLGGLLSPAMRVDLGARKRCVCAAICGAHHGLRMGGDGSQHIGASVAFLLRLAQAALWGEARHAEHTGLDRNQVYQAVLDDWEKGRARLAEKVTLFHTAHWSSQVGGPKWAAIGHAAIALDKAVLDLVRDPSSPTAVAIVSTLNNLVNLCHNNAWFLDKFIEPGMWNLAADLDPRVAILAGPAWYQATLPPMDKRVDLMSRIEAMAPIKINFKAPKGKVVETGAIPSHVAMGSATGKKGKGDSMEESTYTGLVKIAAGIEVAYGQVIPIGSYGTPVKAQARLHGGSAHVQIQVSDSSYVTVDLEGLPASVQQAFATVPTDPSMAGTGTPYTKLGIEPASKRIGLGSGPGFVPLGVWE